MCCGNKNAMTILPLSEREIITYIYEMHRLMLLKFGRGRYLWALMLDMKSDVTFENKFASGNIQDVDLRKSRVNLCKLIAFVPLETRGRKI